MTIHEAKQIALSLPQAEENDHFGKPSFRVRGKIFATLWPQKNRVVLKLTPSQQVEWCEESAESFQPVAGAWGSKGWTNVALPNVERETFEAAIAVAWRNVAPR